MKDIAERLLAAFNGHDATAVAGLYTEGQVTILPAEREPVRGREAKARMLSGFFRAFPDLKMEISLVLASGNHIVCEGAMKGTHTGPLVSHEGEIPPTGRGVAIPLVLC